MPPFGEGLGRLATISGEPDNRFEPGFAPFLPVSEVHVVAAGLMAKDGFLETVMAMSAELIAIYQSNPRMGRLLGSHRRWFMVHLGYALATARQIDPQDEGLTAARMTILMERYNLASRNTVSSFIAELKAYRFVADIPGHVGRRSRPLAPTALAEAGMIQWLGTSLRSLDRLDGGSRQARLMAEPDLMPATQARLARILAEVDEWLHPTPDIQLLFNMEAGGLVLDSLLTRLDPASRGQRLIPLGKLNVSGMARQFMMSRIHLDRVLRRVEEVGSLVRMPDGSHAMAASLVVSQVRRQALKLAVVDLTFADAIRNPGRKIDFFA